jgi:hypothetical protein
VLLLSCTLGARLPAAVHDSLWQDEIATERVISQPDPQDALRQVARRESTPPAFFLTAWAVDHAATALDSGLRPARSLRVLSLVFSLLTTGLTFLLACKLLPLWAAALAGLIVSFSGQLVVHGAELRSYAMLALAYVAFAFVLERAVARPGRLRLALLAGVVAVGSLTHYFFLLALATGVLWLVRSVRDRAVSLRVGAALAVGLVPLAVWTPYWLQQYQHSHFGPNFTWARLVSFLPVLFAPDVIVREAGRTVQVTVSLAVIGSAVLLLRRPDGRLFAALALLPLLVGWVVWAAGQSGVGNPRNLIGVVPFVAIALSWACASLPWRRVSQAVAVLVGVLVVGGFAAGQETLGRTPYDRIAHEVSAQGFNRDEPLVFFGYYGGMIPVGWYLTSDASPDLWPRLYAARPTEGRCDAVEAVVMGGAGREWLGQHRSDILAETSTPHFGNASRGKRAPKDIVIARLRWSSGILASAAAASGFLFYRADTPSACLRPRREWALRRTAL